MARSKQRSILKLAKLSIDDSVTDRIAASPRLRKHHAHSDISTGLIHVERGAEDLHHPLGTVQTPLSRGDVRGPIPVAATLTRWDASLR